MRASGLVVAICGLPAALAGPHGKAASCPVEDASIVAHSGKPTGKEEVHNNSLSSHGDVW